MILKPRTPPGPVGGKIPRGPAVIEFEAQVVEKNFIFKQPDIGTGGARAERTENKAISFEAAVGNQFLLGGVYNFRKPKGGKEVLPARPYF